MAKSNPNGSNQYNLDPRQKLCWEFYTNPKGETFGNALQSALKAGYEENYAKTITVTEWFLEKVRRMNLLGKAEKVLEETLDMNTTNEEGKIDSGLHRIKQDTAKFIASTQGKNEGYSTRVEQTGVDGKDLIPENTEEIKRLTEQLNAIHRGTSISSDGESSISLDT